MKRDSAIGVGIIGAGLIGSKRAAAIRAVGGARLRAVYDPDLSRAKMLAGAYGADVAQSASDLLARKDIDFVIIAVPNKFIRPAAVAAFRAGKHVLAEKPLGRNAREALAIVRAARSAHKVLAVGFNHRFHAGIMRARELFRRGVIGKLLFIRARYGHGGRRGMEKEWRFRKDISGGGELLDQGVHIIDLARWFGGEPERIYGVARTKFWDTRLDDNAFVIMENKNVIISFHVSTTQWKNIFSFELFGTKGFLTIEGKGGSYGTETLMVGIRPPQGGVPQISAETFPRDTSWEAEWKHILAAVRGRVRLIGDGADGLAANRIAEAIYRSSRTGRTVKLTPTP